MHQTPGQTDRTHPLENAVAHQNTLDHGMRELREGTEGVEGGGSENGDRPEGRTERASLAVSFGERIYSLLKDRTEPVKNYEIARELKIKKSRAIQRTGDEDGVLERARDHIYTKYGLLLCTNFKGSKLIANPFEAKAYVAQVKTRAINSFKPIRAMDRRINDALRQLTEESQFKLNLPAIEN